jgi:MoxR-like ATPase
MDGTYPLPEAQLDRFFMKVVVPYPSASELLSILTRTTFGERPVARPAATAEQLQAMIALARQVPIAEHLGQHIVDLVMATQPSLDSSPASIRRYVRVGSSPRGAQALMLAAKASALLDGRPNVRIEDIRDVAIPVLRHRLVTGYDAVADGMSTDELVREVLAAVPAPAVTVRGA